MARANAYVRLATTARGIGAGNFYAEPAPRGESKITQPQVAPVRCCLKNTGSGNGLTQIQANPSE